MILDYKLINLKYNNLGNSKPYADLRITSSEAVYLIQPKNYTYHVNPEDKESPTKIRKNVLQVIVNKSNYSTPAICGYPYEECNLPTEFIIYYTDSNKKFRNTGPVNERITFELGKTYIYEPIKIEHHSYISDWEKWGKFIDYDTKEIVGYYNKYNGLLE